MRRRRSARPLMGIATIAVLACALLMWTSVGADLDDDGAHRPDPGMTSSETISVQSGPNGITVRISVTETTPGATGSPNSAINPVSTAPQPTCTASLMNIGNALSSWYQAQAPLHPGAAPWTVACDDGFFSVVWIPTEAAEQDNVQVVAGDGADIDPRLIALELLNHIPIPDIGLEANPSTGLVALSSWFWIDGYDGVAIGASDSLAGTTVDVEVQPANYHWDFGDGSTIETTSLGVAFPAESDIQHTYEQSSLSAGGEYTITVEATFEVRYRVNGGAWQELDPITRSFTTGYPVQQVQSVITEAQP